MKKHLRIMAMILAVLLVSLMFVGCVGKEANSKSEEKENVGKVENNTEKTTTGDVDLSEFKVGFAQDTLNQPWRSYQADCVKSAFAKYGIDCEITDGGGSSETQISNIEDMLVGGIDLLVVSPAQEAALTPVVTEAYKSGVPVVCIDRGVTGKDYTTYVHADNYAIGGMVADWLAEQFKEKYGEEKGNVVVLEGVAGATTTVQRGEGFLKRIEEAYPDINIMASQPADFNRATAMSVMEDFLQAYDNIDAIFTHADESTMGAISAIENAGRREEMLITSVNGTMEGIKAVLDKRLDMTVMYTNASGPGVEMAVKILSGEEVPKDITIDPVVIDGSNAEQFYTADIYSPDPMSLEDSTYQETK